MRNEVGLGTGYCRNVIVCLRNNACVYPHLSYNTVTINSQNAHITVLTTSRWCVSCMRD